MMRSVFYMAAITFLGLLAWPVVEVALMLREVRPGIESTAQAMKWLTDCKANRACLTSQILATTGTIKAASAQSYQSSRELSKTASEVRQLVTDIRPHAARIAGNGEKISEQILSASGEFNRTMTEFSLMVGELRQDAVPAMALAKGDLDKLGKSLDNLDRLTADLSRQLAEGGDIAGTMAELRRATAGFGVLVEDPNIRRILASSADTSEHLAAGAESVDIALRPWRKKANQLKMILRKAAGMIKFVWAF
ncbi:MAG: hypothetical protein IT160_12200 [Bryobacterales bacterium]|nr:hypothetical protein [Bryobacterales bacterium]